MGTMELAWALDDMTGRPPNLQVVAFVKAALRDLTRPAPAAAVTIRHGATELVVTARLRAADPRILRVIVRPSSGGRGCADSLWSVCRLPIPRCATRFAAVAIDPWGASQPLIVTVQPDDDRGNVPSCAGNDSSMAGMVQLSRTVQSGLTRQVL
jgi:hypothetical protein